MTLETKKTSDDPATSEEQAGASSDLNADRLAFLSALSHELRTPLNTIGGFSEIMAEQMLGPLENPKYQEYIRDIRRSTVELRAIIEDGLNLPMLENAIRRGGTIDRQMLDLSPDLICAFRDDEIIMMNAAGKALVGIDPETSETPSRIENLFDTSCRTEFLDNISELSRDMRRIPLTLCSTDGRTIRAEVATQSVELEGGQAFLLIARDVTDRDRAERQARDREERLYGILDAVIDGIITVNDQGKIESMNKAAAGVLRLSENAAVDQPISRYLISPANGENIDFMSAFRHVLKGKSEKDVHRWIGATADGRDVPVEVGVSVMKTSDRSLLTIVLRDISSRIQSEDRLRESEQRYALAAAGANDGLWDWDIETDQIYFSDRWKTMIGLDPHEDFSSPEDWFNLVHRDDILNLKSAISGHREGKSDHLEVTYRMRHRNGKYRWMLTRGMAVFDEQKKPMRMAGSQSDVTEQRKAQEQLIYDAFHDPLTGLPNRALFMDRLNHAIRRARRKSAKKFAVLFIDVDRFKVINDSLGHSFGDDLLISIAKRLQECIRLDDTIARLGGDEFTILAEDLTDLDIVEELAERVVERFEAPFNISGREVFTSVSVGVLISNEEHEKAEDMLRDADLAMYRAKSEGRARYEMFATDMREHAMTIMELDTALRHALDRDELELFYQPIVNLQSKKLSGFEALIRWRSSDRGLVPPNDFIPLAEETGLIVQIGDFVIDEASRQKSLWKTKFGDDGPDWISINVSARQLVGHDIVPVLHSALDDYKIGGEEIKVEITESLVMENPMVAESLFQRLKDMNVPLCIDDFGTGYSSLGALHRFPIDVLKIDKSFVQSSSPGGNDREMIRTIAGLAHNLGLSVVAEGIETEIQLAEIRAIGCEFGQGYFFAKPLTAEEAGEFIRNYASLLKA
jgi:diguanylate cyclase (GGDEF)-like protein/PAS domain S-box-containing protein